MQDRNLFSTLCDDDNDGHNGIENGNIILYGDQGQSHEGGGYGGGHGGGGGYDEYSDYCDYVHSGPGYGQGYNGGQAYPSHHVPVRGGGYVQGGHGQHDYFEYQGPSGYGTG